MNDAIAVPQRLMAIARERFVVGCKYEGTHVVTKTRREIVGDHIEDVPYEEEVPTEHLVYCEPGDIIDVTNWAHPDSYGDAGTKQISLLHDYAVERHGEPVNLFDPWETFDGPRPGQEQNADVSGGNDNESPVTSQDPGNGGDGVGNGEGGEGVGVRSAPEPPSPVANAQRSTEPPRPPQQGKHHQQKRR